MYEFKGIDEDGFAIYEDATEKTTEQIEAEKAFEEWLKNYEANRKAR